MGLRLPDGCICRFKALPFGASQAPALFTSVSNKFARLLYMKLKAEGLSGVVIVVYVDDVLLAAPSFDILKKV